MNNNNNNNSNNNMIREPNLQNRPSSIFNFDTYPCSGMNNLTATTQTTPIDWSCIPLLQQQQQQQQLDKTTRQFCTNYQPNSTTFGNYFLTTQTTNPVVQFPFPTTTKIDAHQYNFGYNVSNLSTTGRCFKRKTDSPPLSKPIKQHITEEKMAEHMSNLHISSENVRITDQTSSTTIATNETEESEFERTRRLYMCEEMRKLQQHDPILPQAILSKLQRPCTALVLWQPPKRLLDLNPLEEENNNNNSDNNNNDNNNNDTNIQMDMDNL